MDTFLAVGCGAEVAAFDSLPPDLRIHLVLRADFLHSDWQKIVEERGVELILAKDLPSGSGVAEALARVREKWPHLPFVVVGDGRGREEVERWLIAGADEYISTEEFWRLEPAIRRALRAVKTGIGEPGAVKTDGKLDRLFASSLSIMQAKDLPTLGSIVVEAARDLLDAAGATFLINEDRGCYVADEGRALGPFWQPQSRLLAEQISEWVTTHQEPALVQDLENDHRVLGGAGDLKTVKSLLMTPIGCDAPVGTIGIYWAARRSAVSEEVERFQALAKVVTAAVDNIRLRTELENQVKDRSHLLQQTNRELEIFSSSISHDLRSPITAILGFTQMLSETIAEGHADEARGFCDRIIQHAHRMSGLIRDLLRLTKIVQTDPKYQAVNLSDFASQALYRLKETDQGRSVHVTVSKNLMARADPELIGIVLENLLSNAWKFTAKAKAPSIEFGGECGQQDKVVYFVRDNGEGFHPRNAQRIFAPFQQLHDPKDFAGVGVGLATVQRIIHKHGGRVWADSVEGKGATFYFTLPGTGALQHGAQELPVQDSATNAVLQSRSHAAG